MTGTPVGSRGHAAKVGDLTPGEVVSVDPDRPLRQAAKTMHEAGVGSLVVLDDDALVGILTERDLMRSMATEANPDSTPVRDYMTADVITVEPDWEVYEAAAEMTDRRIRHLVVTSGNTIHGVLSIRDVLLAGQRVELTAGNWAVLRDPLTFSVRERRRLQRALLQLDGGPAPELNVDPLVTELVGSWSFDAPLPADAEAVAALTPPDRDLLRAAVLDELPELQRAVQPSPGWRHRRG